MYLFAWKTRRKLVQSTLSSDEVRGRRQAVPVGVLAVLCLAPQNGLHAAHVILYPKDTSYSCIEAKVLTVFLLLKLLKLIFANQAKIKAPWTWGAAWWGVKGKAVWHGKLLVDNVRVIIFTKDDNKRVRNFSKCFFSAHQNLFSIQHQWCSSTGCSDLTTDTLILSVYELYEYIEHFFLFKELSFFKEIKILHPMWLPVH